MHLLLRKAKIIRWRLRQIDTIWETWEAVLLGPLLKSALKSGSNSKCKSRRHTIHLLAKTHSPPSRNLSKHAWRAPPAPWAKWPPEGRNLKHKIGESALWQIHWKNQRCPTIAALWSLSCRHRHFQESKLSTSLTKRRRRNRSWWIRSSDTRSFLSIIGKWEVVNCSSAHMMITVVHLRAAARMETLTTFKMIKKIVVAFTSQGPRASLSNNSWRLRLSKINNYKTAKKLNQSKRINNLSKHQLDSKCSHCPRCTLRAIWTVWLLRSSKILRLVVIANYFHKRAIDKITLTLLKQLFRLHFRKKVKIKKMKTISK